MLDSRMKEPCRICARELCGNQRRWIFHPGAKLSLQVLLSYALGRELGRDGRGEFACSKCAFMLERMFRFDTVMARVEALSLERLHKLLLEKHRLRQGIAGLYRRNNGADPPAPEGPAPSDARYSALLQEDLTYSLFESWAEQEAQELSPDPPLCPQCHASPDSGPRPRKCTVCAALRVPDCDYEAVCKVPRKVARSTSCGPSTRHSSEEATPSAPPPAVTPTSSAESLDLTQDCCSRDLPSLQTDAEEESRCRRDALALLRSLQHRPVRSPRGSRIPVLTSTTHTTPDHPDHPPAHLLDMEELWLDEYLPLRQYENTAAQCVQQLQAKIRESEDQNKKLQQRLGEMESELCCVREAASLQEETTQTFRDSLRTKDCEMADLHHLVEEQKLLLVSQQQQQAPGGLQADVLELQAALFSSQLELQGLQVSLQRHQRREEDATRATQRLRADLQGASQQRQEAQQHGRDLAEALQKTRAHLRDVEERFREEARRREGELEERERSIRELRSSLERRERLAHELRELVEAQNTDGLVRTLRRSLQERDGDLERAADEKFSCLELKEEELRGLQLVLREKERDLEKLQHLLANNQETVTSLECVLRGREAELEQLREAWLSAQRVQLQREEAHTRDTDALTAQLKAELHTRTREAEELTAVLLSNASVGPGEGAELLRRQLQLKERLIQELLSHRNRQNQQHHTNIQELLTSIRDRERSSQDSAGVAAGLMADQSSRLQDLRRQLSSSWSSDVHVLRAELRRAGEAELQLQEEFRALSRALSEKDDIIQGLRARLGEEPQSGCFTPHEPPDPRRTEDPRCGCGGTRPEEEEPAEEEESKLTARSLIVSQEKVFERDVTKERLGRDVGRSLQEGGELPESRAELQDAGYETCGRSETEAEREDTSSPEFDDLELCTSLSGPEGGEGPWWPGVASLRAQEAGLDLQGRAHPGQSSTHEDQLRALVSRVTSLEEQLRKGKGQQEGGGAAHWPGRFDSLVQAQARELSQLRQRVREGGGACHVLAQHLRDVTKSFEELLRFNDIDFYTGQSFRAQLSHAVSLAHSLARDHGGAPEEEEEEEEELLATRLSEELQQKDALLLSLQRSGHASCLSDDHASSTREDLDLCSSSEDESPSPADSLGHDASPHPPCPPSITSSHSRPPAAGPPGLTGVAAVLCSTPLRPPTRRCVGGPGFSVAEVQRELQTLRQQLGHSSPQLKTTPGFPLRPRPRPHPEACLLQSRGSLAPDVSGGSSGCQWCHRAGGAELMEEHLREIRSLRRRLEDSIRTNDGLRRHLQERLASSAPHGGATPTNIYIQGLDSIAQLSSENQALKERSRALQDLLQLTSTEGSREVERLRETVRAGRAQLQKAELEREELAEQCRRLQTQSAEDSRAAQKLRLQTQSHQENVCRLQSQLSVLQQQLRACQGAGSPVHLEPRDWGVFEEPGKLLRTAELTLSPPVRDTGFCSPASPDQPRPARASRVPSLDPLGSLEAGVAEGAGPHMVGHLEDLCALQEQLLEGTRLVQEMKDPLKGELRRILEAASSLSRLFWRAAPSHTEVWALRRRLCEQERLLRDATESLRTSSRCKDGLEQLILAQLSRTRSVLKQARSNLQSNQLKMASLGCPAPR